VADFQGRVFAFDPKDRKIPLWEQATPHGVRAAPVVQGDDLVVLTGSGDVTVLRRASGEVVASYQLKGRFSAPPAPAGEKDLIFASEDGVVMGVVRLTGQVLWEKRLPGARITRPLPVRGRAVFAAPRPGELVAFDTRTGDVIYATDKGSPAPQAEILATNRIFFAHGPILSAFAPGGDGYGLAWTFQAEGRILAGPIVEGDAVYIGDEKGNLYRLEAND
jgi:outer membrane protein assembly factor BamB